MFALYAGLPQNFPGLPSFGPEDVPIGPVVFAGHRQNDPDEVEVEMEEHELAVVRQPIQEEENMELTRVQIERQAKVSTDWVEEAKKEQIEVEVEEQTTAATAAAAAAAAADVNQLDQKVVSTDLDEEEVEVE